MMSFVVDDDDETHSAKTDITTNIIVSRLETARGHGKGNFLFHASRRDLCDATKYKRLCEEEMVGMKGGRLTQCPKVNKRWREWPLISFFLPLHCITYQPGRVTKDYVELPSLV